MPSALREHQYELAPVDGDGLVFGTEDTGYLTITRPQHVSGDLRTADVDAPLEDGSMMGRDFVGPKSVTFEMGVLTDVNNIALAPGSPLLAHQMNLDYLDAIEGWWRDPVWRESPRSMAMLRACEGGRVSRAYGRPRRYDEAAGSLTRQGYTPIVCDFVLRDNRWYSDEEYDLDVPIIKAPEGGLVAPLVAPLTTTSETENNRIVTVAGKVSTWLVVEFQGPVLNPSITVAGMTIGLNGSIGSGDSVVIDPRPWVRTVLRESDGANYAGLLSRQTPAMRRLQIKPGTYAVTFRGNDPTGTAHARLRWRNARSRP